MNRIELNENLARRVRDELQIVVIDNFYDSVDQDEVLGWMSKLFRFKMEGYRASYPYGILPFGGSDLIGTHWILCQKSNDDLRPLMGFKTIDSKRADQFRMEFPGLGIVCEPGLESQKRALESELEKARARGYGLGYLGSWTVDPKFRRDLDLVRLCRKTSSALFSKWVTLFDVQAAVTYASLRFHVEKFHEYMGFLRLQAPGGDVLPDFKAKPFFDEPACISILHRENHSLESQQDAEDLKHLWDNRIFLGAESSPLAIRPKPLEEVQKTAA